MALASPKLPLHFILFFNTLNSLIFFIKCKTELATPLLKILQWLPVLFKVKVESLTKPLQSPIWFGFLYTSNHMSYSPLNSLCSSHWPFCTSSLRHTSYVSIPGCLQWLFSFLKVSLWLTLSPHSSLLIVTFGVNPSSNLLLKISIPANIPALLSSQPNLIFHRSLHLLYN